MGLFARALDAVVSRGEPVSMDEFGRILGESSGSAVSTRSGVTVTTDRSLTLSAYWSGLRYLAETVAGLPAPVYRDLPDGHRQRRALPPWRVKPHPAASWYTLIEFLVVSMVNRGNGFCWKDRNDLGQVVGLTPINPDRVRFGLDRVTEEKVYEIRLADGTRRPATSYEVFHVPGLTADGFFGIDAIRAHASGLGVALAADEYASAFYSGSDHLRGYISLPKQLAEDEILRLKAQWQRFHQGLANAHEFGVLGDGASYETIGLDAEQTQLLATRQFSVTEIARMLRIPPHKLYDLERATFSNIEHQAIEAVTDSIRPWVRRIEAATVDDPHLLPRRTFLEFTLEGLLRGDTESRYRSYQSAIDAGWMAPAEPRRLENLPPADGLDYFRFPLNTAAIGPDADRAPQARPNDDGGDR